MGTPISKRATFNLPLEEWIRLNCMAHEQHELSIPWKIIFPHALWFLWRQRNNIAFDGGSTDSSLHHLCLQRAAELFAVLQVKHNPPKNLISIRWELPSCGWTKLNTDGLANGWPGRAGAGGLIRDDYGRWMRGFRRNLGISNSMLVECWAFRDGMKLARELRIRFLEVELDAKAVSDSFCSCLDDKTLLRQLILDCRRLSREVQGFKLKNVFRKANKAADFFGEVCTGQH